MQRVYMTFDHKGHTYGIKVQVDASLDEAAAHAKAQSIVDGATFNWLMANGAIVRCG